MFCLVGYLFFFFKQKTAYEMVRSDWSSDVCSSDLVKVGGGKGVHRCRERFSTLLETGQPPQGPRCRTEIFQPVEIEQYRANPDALELLRGRDVGPGVVQDDQIGLPCGHRLDVRRHPVADAGHGERRGRIVAPCGTTHETITSTDGKQDLGERGKQGHDALSRPAVRPSGRPMTAEKNEENNAETSKHHPSR